MRTGIAARLSTLFGLVALFAACSAPRLQVIPRITQLKFDGTVAANVSGSTLVDNNVRDDLGLDGTSTEFGGRADLEFIGSTFTLAHSPAAFSGNGKTAGLLSKDGVILPAGTSVATAIDLDLTSGVWTFDFVPGDTLDLGLGFGVHLLDFDSTVRSTGAIPGTITLDETLPVPVLAGRAALRLGDFDFSALASGLKFSRGSDEATLFDLDLLGRWWLLGGEGRLAAALTAGWRKTQVTLDYTDGNDHTEADLSLSGLYYGLSVSF